MNGSHLTLGLVGALAVAGALGRRGSRSEQTWYVHGTRVDLAKEIVSSGVMRGSDSRKFGNREVVFAAEQSERARDAVNAWASARYNVYKNPGKGGTAIVRFRASRPPDLTGKGEAAWMGDLVIEDAHIVDEKSQQTLKRQAEARWGRGSRAMPDLHSLGQRVKAWAETDEAYRLLDADPATSGSTSWLAGGCAVLAEALQRVEPKLALVGVFDGHGALQHVLVKAPGDLYLDADGASTRAALERRWATRERVPGARVRPITRWQVTQAELPLSESLSREVARALSSR